LKDKEGWILGVGGDVLVWADCENAEGPLCRGRGIVWMEWDEKAISPDFGFRGTVRTRGERKCHG